MKNNFKIMFLFLTIISTLFLISSSTWLNMWIWLEINLISFIAILINSNKKLSIEASLLYFLIQSIASIILLFSFIMILYFNSFYFLMFFSILMKLGSGPFHYWLPSMIEGLNWLMIFFLLTWQKINPLIMLYFNNNFSVMNLFIIMSLIIGTISGLNYLSLKKMMSFSSINQLSWMMMSLMNNKLMKLYLIFYFFLMWMIIKSMIFFNLKYLNQLYNLNLKNKFMKLFIFMNFLSLGGLPPFLGFYPKMIMIMKMNNLIMTMMMILFTLLSLFMYLRIIMSILILNSMKINKLKKKYNFKKFLNYMKFMIINNLSLLLLMFLNYMFKLIKL